MREEGRVRARGIELIVSDQHGGLVLAIRTHFQGVTWQRCQTYFCEIFDATPKKLREELFSVFVRFCMLLILKPHGRCCNKRWNESNVAKAISVLENGFDDATAVLLLPESTAKRLRTTNGMERLNEKIRRRERVIFL